MFALSLRVEREVGGQNSWDDEPQQPSGNPCDLPVHSSSSKKEAGWKKKRQGPFDLNKGNEIQLTTMKQYREGGGQLVFKWYFQMVTGGRGSITN